jgi:peptidylprolyl isomerase
MKLTPALFLLSATALAPLSAQTTASKPAARPASARPAAGAAACVKHPEISSKIPALDPTLPCIKHLYTITTIPTVKIENISPLEPASLNADLGIESTSFSLDYVDTKIGTGRLAGGHSWYDIHYTGYLVDGTKFDSSIDRGKPITIQYGEHQVIPGWDTGLAGMHVGGKRRLFIPYQLAYGNQGKSPIPPKAELVFDIELVSISETPPPAPAPPARPAGAPGGPPSGSQPAPAPGSPTTPPKPAANPANPVTTPPPTDPTKPTAAPPASTNTPKP